MLIDLAEIGFRVTSSRRYGRRDFPERADYEQALRHHGQADGIATSPPEIVAGVARHWHTTGQTGCLFAKVLARQATPSEWPTAVVASLSADAFREIDRTLAAGVSQPEVQLVSLLFPSVVSISAVKHVVHALDANTSLAFFEDRAVPDWVRVAGRFDIGDGVLAWVMAFGPFPSWPPTRRGPVFELVIRTKPKRDGLFEKLNQDASLAHLADIDLGYDTARTSRMFDGTVRATQDVLGGRPDGLSAAKTTFSFPVEDWDGAPGLGLSAGRLADEPDYPPEGDE